MRWSERYLQKKLSGHTVGDVVSKVSKGGLDTLDTATPYDRVQEKSAPTGETSCPTCGCGSLWRDQSGAWQCEQCAPPGAERVTHWRNFAGGKVRQAPPPAELWLQDLDRLLNRVATAFEWSRTDVTDFRQWARRSAEGVQDARVFLQHEAAKLPAAGLDVRRRVVLDMLAADPTLRVAWTCADDGADPLILTLAIRDSGAGQLAIPRAKFDALALPGLIGQPT